MAEITKQHESGHTETHPQAFWDKLAEQHPAIAALYTQVGAPKTVSTPPEVAGKPDKPAIEPKKA